MQKRFAAQRAAHAVEPEPGSFRAVTGDGDDADLFNLNHYPVHAVCRVCSEPIRAEAFLRAFRHEQLSGPPARTYSPVSWATKARQSPDRAADSDTARCECPTSPSARSSTGRSEAVACCRAAHIL